MHVPNFPLTSVPASATSAAIEPSDTWLWSQRAGGPPLRLVSDGFTPPMLSICVDYPRRVVAVSGEIVGRSGELLAEALSLLLARNPGDTTLDVSQVVAIDAAGFAMLVGIHRRLTAVGAQLRAEAPRRHLLDLFDVTHMLQHSS